MPGRKSFLLRMDPALWDELEGWARQELRSVNGQIEFLLRQAVQKRKGMAPPAASPPATSVPSPEEPSGGAGESPPEPASPPADNFEVGEHD